MSSRITLLIGILVLGTLGFFIHPIPALAADGLCAHLTHIIDESNQGTLFYDYDPSTKSLTSLNQSNVISWYDESSDGRWVAMYGLGEEKGVEFLRFVDRATQRAIDHQFEDAFISGASMGGRVIKSGWSPDNQLYAVALTRFESDSNEGGLSIFGRDRSLLTEILFEEQGGRSVWAWLPDSKRIVTALADPDELDSDKIHYTVRVSSISGSTVEAKLAEPIYSRPSLLVSPDGSFVAAVDAQILFVVDTRTGEVVTVSQAISSMGSRRDVAWSRDSQFLLYKVPAESTDASHVNVMRYSVASEESTVVIEDVGIPYPLSAYGPIDTSDQQMGILISQQSEEMISFHFIDAQTGEPHEMLKESVNDLSLNAMMEWSPLGDVIWLSANTTSFFRPETMTQVTLPEGNRLVSTSSNPPIRWSENGEWVSVLVQNSETTRSFAIINTKTGGVRMIPSESESDEVYASPSNTGDVIVVQNGSLSLVSDDSSLLLSPEGLPWYYGTDAAVWSPDGTKIAAIEYSPTSGLSILKIYQSNGTLVSSVDIPVSVDLVTSLEWVPCV